MEKIFEYDNYRTFLKDYTARQKVADKKFSFRYFASKVGFSSHSFLDNVIHGRRNLTLESVRKKTKALNMDRK